MFFFRRSPPIDQLIYRLVRSTDLPLVLALLEQTEWAMLAIPHDEIPLVTQDGLSLVAEHGGKLWAVVLAGWSAPPMVWVRALVVHNTLRPLDVLPALLGALERHVASNNVAALYLMSDERDSGWLRPILTQAGYTPQVEVIGYEKRTLFVPDWGNQTISIRPTTPADIVAIAQVDAAAFTPEWVKNDTILRGVMPIAPCYLVAESDGAAIGYAFATLHHGGLVAHLVRIAVLPTYHHQAVGVRLLAEVVQWCRQHDVQVLSLNTQGNNAHAQRLYQWFGFIRNGERQLVLTKDIGRR